MKLSDLSARTVSRTIEIDGEEVAVRLRPAVHTSAFDARVVAAMRGNDARGLAECLAELVAHVDIVLEDGSPIPCTGDAFFELLPLTVMAALWEQVGAVSRPGEAKGGTSAAG